MLLPKLERPAKCYRLWSCIYHLQAKFKQSLDVQPHIGILGHEQFTATSNHCRTPCIACTRARPNLAHPCGQARGACVGLVVAKIAQAEIKKICSCSFAAITSAQPAQPAGLPLDWRSPAARAEWQCSWPCNPGLCTGWPGRSMPGGGWSAHMLCPAYGSTGGKQPLSWNQAPAQKQGPPGSRPPIPEHPLAQSNWASSADNQKPFRSTGRPSFACSCLLIFLRVCSMPPTASSTGES